MSTVDGLDITARVDALTRIAKNNAIADEDLAPFLVGTDGIENPLPRDAKRRSRIRDAFAQTVCRIIDDGSSQSSSTRDTMEAALCSLGFLFGFHIPPPLSQRRESYAARSGLSHSTIVRREREAARIVAETFDEYVRHPKQSPQTSDKAHSLRASIQRSPLGDELVGDDLLDQALQVIEHYEKKVRERDTAIRHAVECLSIATET
ncbi:hypothetical protein G3I13_01705 [Streptomyces sp. SID6673]|nr:hypothetical protein [Streptomyces sp. SID11726]NDZ94876.1 hypothetical protein [Streptomyces sp. SID11726]NEB23036.1 hypothetical protein [Streptomyces sp. SID6673]